MWDVIEGDCTKLLPEMSRYGFRADAVICDPPYHLASIAKRFGAASLNDNNITSRRSRDRSDGAARLARGFMGSATDAGDVSFRADTWKAIRTVMPPGARLACFGGTRTFWRMAAAIEAAGFEYEDTIAWCYGQGLVLRKSRLKPAYEPIMLWRVPGPVRDLGIDDCRISTNGEIFHAPQSDPSKRRGTVGTDIGISRSDLGKFQEAQRASIERTATLGRWPTNLVHDNSDEVRACLPDAPGQIADARADGAVKCSRVYGELRYREDEPSQERRYADRGGTNFAAKPGARRNDSGSAARFFNSCEFSDEEKRLLYQPKATASERMCRCTVCGAHFCSDRAGRDAHRHGSADENHIEGHPTTKPVSLLRHLVRLIAPPGGLVLDPFCGSGTTLEAAVLECRDAVGIEIIPEHAASSRVRMETRPPPAGRTGTRRRPFCKETPMA